MSDHDHPTSSDVDPSDEFRVLHAHWQSDHRIIGIFSCDGVKKFSVTLKDYSIDEPHTWPTDRVTRMILLSATEYDLEGRGRPVLGEHPQIERLVDRHRRGAASASNFVAFEFIDARDQKGTR